MTDSRRIVELTISNVMGIRAVDITPGDGVVTVGGKNAAGKTSLLEAIQMAMGGKPFGPKQPLRRGAKKGKVVVVVDTAKGPLRVTRTFAADGKSSLKIESEEGATFQRPQEILDALVGAIGFDPFEFTLLSDRDQAEQLKGLIGLDFSDMDAKRGGFYDSRTATNRDHKRLTGLLETIPEKETPEKEFSVADLMKELQAARETNTEIDKKKTRAEEAVQDLEITVVKLLDAERLVETLVADVADHNARCVYMKKEYENMPDVINTEIIATKIGQAEGINRDIRDQKQRRETVSDAAILANESDRLTGEIEKIDESKRYQLQQADWPLEGLGFDEGGVTYKGLPFGQCSSAEQLDVSLGMGMAANPELRVLFIRNGSLMDDETMERVRDKATEKGFQVWIERVSSDGEGCSIFIEDGIIAESEVEA